MAALTCNDVDLFSGMRNITIALTVAALLVQAIPVLAQMPPISSPTSYIKQPFDVQRYTLELHIDDLSSKAVHGKCRITVVWLDDVSKPAFPFHLRNLVPDSVVDATGTKLGLIAKGFPQRDTFHFSSELVNDVHTGDTTEITVYYHGTMISEGGGADWGGVQYADSLLYTMGVGFSNPEVSATAYWMPCYDHPSDKAELHMSVFVPKNNQLLPWQGQTSVAATGTELPVVEHDSTYEYRWVENHPTATYLYALNAGPLHKYEFDSVGNTPVRIFGYPRDSAASRISYKLVPRMTALFNRLFAPYPFDQVGYVNTTKGAMEHQGLISFPRSLVNKRDTVNTTAAHELAHQWFGDYVTPLDFRHAWLTESFATYCEGAWIEEVLGWDTYLKNLENQANAYITKYSKQEGVFPLFAFPRLAPSSNYPTTIYAKGGCVVSMMRMLAGDSAFYTALRTYLADHAYGNATTADIVEAMRPALGARTDAFFEEWVYGKGWPMLTINFNETGSGWVAEIQQTQQDTSWPVFTTLPLPITLTSAESGLVVDTMVVMTGQTLTIPIQSPENFAINAGKYGRSLLQIVSTTAVPMSGNSLPRVTLFPQPANDHVRLQWSAPVQASLVVRDVSGKEVLLPSTVDMTDSATIRTADLAAGMYTIIIATAKGEQLLPLVVVR